MLNRKLLTTILIYSLIFIMIIGCSSSSGKENYSDSTAETDIDSSKLQMIDERIVRIGLLKGPSSLGMLEIMENNSQKIAGNNYDFTVMGSPQDIGAKLINGELDIAAIPINMAATLYNKTDKNIRTVAVGTLGVLYLLSNGVDFSTIKDLKGETIYATGQGATPEYVLKYVLIQNGLTPDETVNIEFKGEHAELAALVAEGKVKIAMLPQPFVTTVASKNPDIKIAVDLNDEWRRLTGSELAMTCIVAHKKFIEENSEAMNLFLKDYEHSAEFVNTNIDKAAALSEKFDIIPETVAKIAIPKCGIVFIGGEDIKLSANPVLEILFAANPQSVGGSLPDDAFYYTNN